MVVLYHTAYHANQYTGLRSPQFVGAAGVGRRGALDTASILKRMFESLLKSIFGSKHDRDIRRVSPIVGEINRLA